MWSREQHYGSGSSYGRPGTRSITYYMLPFHSKGGFRPCSGPPLRASVWIIKKGPDGSIGNRGNVASFGLHMLHFPFIYVVCHAQSNWRRMCLAQEAKIKKKKKHFANVVQKKRDYVCPFVPYISIGILFSRYPRWRPRTWSEPSLKLQSCSLAKCIFGFEIQSACCQSLEDCNQ